MCASPKLPPEEERCPWRITVLAHCGNGSKSRGRIFHGLPLQLGFVRFGYSTEETYFANLDARRESANRRLPILIPWGLCPTDHLDDKTP